MPRAPRFSAAGLALRMAAGVVVAPGLWNPTGRSYVGWPIGHAPAARPCAALVGVSLLIALVIRLRAAVRSIGLFGMALAAAFVGSAPWVLASLGLPDLGRASAARWAALTAIGLILGVGLSRSHVRRAPSGQVDVVDASSRPPLRPGRAGRRPRTA